MKVSEIMTRDPATCTADTPLAEVARLMVDCNCGEIPIVESKESGKIVGVVTDRDIVCRTIAKDINPLEKTAGDVMSKSPYSVHPDDDLQECIDIMEEHQVRRVPVVEDDGRCCGIVSQADLARTGSEHEIAEVLQEVSQTSGAPSR